MWRVYKPFSSKQIIIKERKRQRERKEENNKFNVVLKFSSTSKWAQHPKIVMVSRQDIVKGT